jgi:hypothetical protein
LPESGIISKEDGFCDFDGIVSLFSAAISAVQSGGPGTLQPHGPSELESPPRALREAHLSSLARNFHEAPPESVSEKVESVEQNHTNRARRSSPRLKRMGFSPCIGIIKPGERFSS